MRGVEGGSFGLCDGFSGTVVLLQRISEQENKMPLELNTQKAGRQSVAEFSANIGATVDRIRKTQDPLVLTENGQGVAVLVDIESFRSLLDELELLRDVQQGSADLEAGRVIPHEEVRQLLHARYSS